MYTFLRILILPSLLLLFSCGQTDEEALIESFENYKSHLENKDYDKMWDYMDQASQKLYSDLLTHVRYSDRATIENLDTMSKSTILVARGLIDKDKLNSFTPKQFFRSYSEFEEEQAEWSKVTLETININENTASATFDDGKSDLKELEKLGLDPIKLYFTKEDGSWKLNAERTTREIYLMMDTMIEEAKKSGAPFDSFVDAVLMGAEMRFPNFDESLIWVPTAK